MAIQQRIINGSNTEIYAGGGNFITQSAPTNFHRFWPRKILAEGETADDYREVTPAEKASIEAADAKWVEPSEELLAETATAGIAYNPKTGYFELNTLTDITTEQIRLILLYIQRPPYNVFASNHSRNLLRTNLWLASGQSTSDEPVSLKQIFLGWSAAEVINLNNGLTEETYSTRINGTGTFKNCTKLIRILGPFRFYPAPDAQAFLNCTQLRSFPLRDVAYDIDLHYSPNIDLDTLIYMVTYAINKSPITITLHPDAHARLTEELIAQAAEKQITFATT